MLWIVSLLAKFTADKTKCRRCRRIIPESAKLLIDQGERFCSEHCADGYWYAMQGLPHIESE